MDNTDHKPTLRVLSIVELLATSREGYNLTEIASQIGAPISTIVPIMRTLCHQKYAMLNEHTHRYTINIKAFVVGSSYLQMTDIMSMLRQIMSWVVNTTGETCQLGVLSGGDVLFLLREDSPEPLRLSTAEGRRLPAYCTAIGKALLLDYDLEQLKVLYKNHLHPVTPNTITDFSQLRTMLDTYKQLGYTLDLEENTKDMQCIAVPLIADGTIITAMSITVPTFRMDKEKEEQVLSAMLEGKKKIESLFGELHITKDSFGRL